VGTGKITWRVYVVKRFYQALGWAVSWLEAWDETRYSHFVTIDQIAMEALALPSEERALLADRLVESLDASDANGFDKLWAAEAKRRRDEVRQGLVRTIPGEKALAQVRRSLGR
jgi:hypothetical protein